MHKIYPYIGIAGAILGYSLIVVAITASPWFNWFNNALSDLGNTSLHSSKAWIFNFGLMLAGALSTKFSVLLSKDNFSWKYLVWSVPLAMSSVDLTLIGIFNESFGTIHLIISVIFFFMIALILFLFSYVSFLIGMPRLGAVGLAFGIFSCV